MFIRMFLLSLLIGIHLGLKFATLESRHIAPLNQVDTSADLLQVSLAPSWTEPVHSTQVSNHVNPDFTGDNGMITIVIDRCHREETSAAEENPSSSNTCPEGSKPNFNLGKVSDASSSNTLGESNSVSRVPSCSKSEPVECMICLGEIGENDEFSESPKCPHIFHKWIDNWLGQHKTCPTCRQVFASDIENPDTTTTQEDNQRQELAQFRHDNGMLGGGRARVLHCIGVFLIPCLVLVFWFIRN